MPLRATDNPLVLPLLGLLLEQPRHQYALLAALRERSGHLRVRTGSVYTLIGSIRTAGWIEPEDREDGGEGAGPVVFRLTTSGTEEFRRRVVAELADTDPVNQARFITALAYVGILDRPTAIATLGARVEALRERATTLDAAVDGAGIPSILMIEAVFFASQTRHDIVWLEEFITRIGDVDQVWPGDTVAKG